MAFLDFRETTGGAAGQAMATRSMAPAFEAREWRVIEMARRDGLSSLHAPSRLARIGAWFFGERPNPRLADPRLETLRRAAVQAWHRGYAVPVATVEAFREAGFSLDQLELMLTKIGAGRVAGSRQAA